MIVNNHMRTDSRLRRIIPVALAALIPAVAVLFLISTAAALIDLTIFGPKRYDRLKGKPTVYTDTFDRCSPATQGVLKVTNGDAKHTRIKAAEIFLNGVEVAAEQEFKQQVPFFEKVVPIGERNVLRVVLKSGMQDDPNAKNVKEQSFLIIEVIGKGCDDTPPVVSSPEPADGSLLNTAVPAISASYADNDNGSGIDPSTARIIVAGKDVTSDASVAATGISYLPRSNLPEGGHTVTVSVLDRARNSASLTWGFTTDTIAPVVSITSHQNGQYLNSQTITLSGSIDDPAATVTVNGQAAQVSGDSFSYAGLPLTEGPNSITVSATDPAGNTGTATITINLDTQAPVITIAAPADNSFVNTSSITAAGGINEPAASLTINGMQVTPTASNTFSLAALSLIEGPNTITVIAVDRAGNSGSASVTVNLDTVQPVPSIASPAANAYVNTPNLTVAGIVNEPIIAASVNGSSAQISEMAAGFSLAALGLTEGPNDITATVTDRAGNHGTASITVNLDTVAPVVQITSHQTGRLLNTPKVTITGTVSETVTSLTVNGTDATVN